MKYIRRKTNFWREMSCLKSFKISFGSTFKNVEKWEKSFESNYIFFLRFFSSLDSLTRENPWLVFSLSRFIKGKSRAVLVVMQKHKLNMNNSCQLSKTIMSTVQLSKAKKVCGCGVASLSEKKNLDQKAINELFHHCIATDWSSFFSSSSCLGELPSQRYSFRIASSTSRPFFF